MDKIFIDLGLKEQDISLCQYCLNQLIENTDIQELERWAFSGKCNDETLNNFNEYRARSRDILKKVKLTPLIVDILFIQYLMADHMEREFHKDNWVEYVVNYTEKERPFPSAPQIIKDFFMNK